MTKTDLESQKQPLYLFGIGVRSAYILPSSGLTSRITPEERRKITLQINVLSTIHVVDFHRYRVLVFAIQAEKLDYQRQQVDTGNKKVFERSIAGQINKEALQVADTIDNAQNIPPHDLTATAPQLAYRLDKIIFLSDILELSNAGAELTTDHYPSFVCNRSYKLERLQNDEEKKRLAGIFQYITHLVKFKDKHSMDGVLSSAKHSRMPGFLFQRFSSMFGISDHSERLPDDKRDLLISYVIVLPLFADDFRSNPSDIARDLRIHAVVLRSRFEYLGCKFVREKNVLLATLPVPLKFPSIRRKRRR